MKNTNIYIFGSARVPPWAGDVLKDTQFDEKGTLIRATILTPQGLKSVSQGDVLMRIDSAVVLLNKRDAKKYGVTR